MAVSSLFAGLPGFCAGGPCPNPGAGRPAYVSMVGARSYPSALRRAAWSFYCAKGSNSSPKSCSSDFGCASTDAATYPWMYLDILDGGSCPTASSTARMVEGCTSPSDKCTMDATIESSCCYSSTISTAASISSGDSSVTECTRL